MKKRISIIIISAAAILCGCGGDNTDEAITIETSESISETSLQETAAESISVTFAKAETEISETTVIETTVTETEITEELKENQAEYRDKNMSVLMEFTGAEELKYYPKASRLPEYRDYYYVLHSCFTVKNLSKKSFDFIPQKMIIYGRHNKSSWYMMPITENDTGLTASDNYYTVEPGESVSFNVDFVGEKECIEYANEIKYAYEVTRGTNNIDYEMLNNVRAAEKFDFTDRNAVKKAVSSALDISEENALLPQLLSPKDGEYSVNTPKNSYCFTVESINDGSYIKVSLRLQCITGEAEVFEPNMFRLTRKGGHSKMPSTWGFDEELVEKLPDTDEIAGISDTLYSYPFDLYIRPDGTAEYDMYFFTANDDIADYYMFSYEGKNDVFESMIRVE